MPKELKMPSHKANLSKFGHDLTKILKFSSNTGHLIPVYYDLAQAGDKYRFNTEMFTQVTDIVSPAMMHLEEQVDWFFIPLNQLYQFAGDNLYSIDDSHTAYRANISDTSVMPMIQENSLFNYLYETFTNNNDVGDLAQSLDEFGVPEEFNRVRLLQHLGFGNSMKVPQNELSTRGFNPMLLLAYQKIFYDSYRITDRTPNDVLAYNVDDLSGLSAPAISRISKICKIHYRPWKKDFFTSMQVAPLIDVDDISMQQQSQGLENRLSNFNNWLQHRGTQIGNNLGTNHHTPFTSVYASTNYSSSISTALFRGMFAVEKLSEITRRAAKRYDAQVLAHFGFKIPDGVSSEVYRLGSDKSIIQVNEVVAMSAGTAGDVTTTLGERGGRASGYNKNKNKSFVCPCDGILMAVYSAVPSADYGESPLDAFNTFSTRADYFHPEFDRLGMAPIFKWQATGINYRDSENTNEIIGWNWRYLPYKLKYNQCLGAFNHTEYQYWTIKRDVSVFFNAQNQFSETFFYCGPNVLDNILLTHTAYSDTDLVDSDMNIVYQRDCLLHWFKFNVFKSSVISNYSLPNL